MKKTLVIIPAFNEAPTLGLVIEKVKASLPEADILVVNDGSTDLTVKIARKKNVLVASHPFNMSYGVALQTGYKYALRENYDFLVQIDADGQHEPSCLPKLLKVVEKGEADIAIGSRFMKGSQTYKIETLRYLGMILFRKIISLVIKQKITDSTSGFRAFNKKVLRFAASDAYSTDFPVADVLVLFHFAGFKIKEVPIKMNPRTTGDSMIQGIKPIYYTFKMFLLIFLSLFREKKSFKEA